ncbi:hypothetical protein AMECASPLE_022875, partial [Ameca splendens]
RSRDARRLLFNNGSILGFRGAKTSRMSKQLELNRLSCESVFQLGDGLVKGLKWLLF